MTERFDGFNKKPDFIPLPEGFEMPTESVFLAEANRDFYESMFFYKMSKTPDMVENPYASNEKNALIHARVEKIKLILNSAYDTQSVIDTMDMGNLAKDMKIQTTQTYVVKDEVQADEYQVENYLRTGANILEVSLDTDENRLKKVMIKRFSEAKKIASEKNISQEAVFEDQDLYFQLVRRSYSPEELIAENKHMLKVIRQSINPLAEHSIRHGLLIANTDNKLALEDVEKEVASFSSNPRVKNELQESLLELEDQIYRSTYLAIERYWGKDTAGLFFK